jgi:hypothetical protein
MVVGKYSVGKVMVGGYGSGSNLYNLLVNYSATANSLAQKQANKIFSAIATAVLTLVYLIVVIFNQTITTGVTFTKQILDIVLATVTGTFPLSKSISKAIKPVVTGVFSFSRSITKSVVQEVISLGASLVKSVGVISLQSATASLTYLASKTFSRTFQAAMTIIASLAKSVGVTRQETGTASASIFNRSITAILSFVATSTDTVQKTISRIILENVTAINNNVKGVLRGAIAFAMTAIGNLTKQPEKTFSSNVVGTIVDTKQPQKMFEPIVDANITKTNQIGAIRQPTVIAGSSVTKAVSFIEQAFVTVSETISKTTSFIENFVVGTSATFSQMATHLYFQTVAATVSAIGSIQKAVSFISTFNANATLSLIKSIIDQIVFGVAINFNMGRQIVKDFLFAILDQVQVAYVIPHLLTILVSANTSASIAAKTVSKQIAEIVVAVATSPLKAIDKIVVWTGHATAVFGSKNVSKQVVEIGIAAVTLPQKVLTKTVVWTGHALASGFKKYFKPPIIAGVQATANAMASFVQTYFVVVAMTVQTSVTIVETVINAMSWMYSKLPIVGNLPLQRRNIPPVSGSPGVSNPTTAVIFIKTKGDSGQSNG